MRDGGMKRESPFSLDLFFFLSFLVRRHRTGARTSRRGTGAGGAHDWSHMWLRPKDGAEQPCTAALMGGRRERTGGATKYGCSDGEGDGADEGSSQGRML